MDSDNNPAQDSTGLSPTATADEPVLNIPSTASTAGSSNGNKSSSRASSIEALNWSDFEDEINNDENSQINSNLLQSIHSSSESTSSSTSKLNMEHKDKSETSSTLMEETMTASSLDKEMNDKIDEPFEHLTDFENVIRNRRRESACSGDQMVTSYVSVNSDSSSVPLDQMSNVPVLDDGPIWSKGMKHYRFEENRIINQKLTFCVLFSVVLAVGLGLGNLVAYNECEAEHRVIEQTCGKFDDKPIPTSQTVMPSRATATESAIPVSITNTKIPFNNPDTTVQGETFIKPTASTPATAAPVMRKSKPTKPMVDPDYKLHAQELSRVLKMLDELSRKIDQFENTTRQLGGIIMMRDEFVKPKSPKSKFLRMLDEIVNERGIDERKQRKRNKEELNKDNDDEGMETDLNAEAEKVLAKIAEAVLNVMNSNLLSKKESGPVADDPLAEEETKLETNEVFPLDDDSLFVAHGTADKSNFVEKSRKFDKGKILEELKPSTLSIMQTHKFGEDSELELDYRGGDKRVRRESYNSLEPDVQDFDEFKEKHEKLHKNKDKPKSKSKKKRKKSKDKESRHAEPMKVKREKKKDRDGKNVIKNWQADRAKLREENRMRYEKTHRQNKRNENWQIERDVARENIRDETLVDEILNRPVDA